jgi:hypothetical protein
MYGDEEFDRQYDLVIETAEKNNLKNSHWSMYEHLDFDQPHPYGDVKELKHHSDPFWGKPSGDFIQPINGNTWLDLWIAADTLMGKIGDKHHYFIEDFWVDASDNTLRMFLGS